MFIFIRCPDCGVPVAMAPGNKEFQCQNEDCMMVNWSVFNIVH